MVRTKLREMVKTKSARLVYMLVRKSRNMSVVISGPFSVECRVLQPGSAAAGSAMEGLK